MKGCSLSGRYGIESNGDTMRKGDKYLYISAMAFLFMMSVAWSVPVDAFGTNGDGDSRSLSIAPDFKPRLGKYYYNVNFNHVNIGNANIVIGRDGDLYKVQVNAQSIGMVDSLYRLRYRGEATLGTDPLSPVETKMQQEVRSTEKDTTIKFQDNGTIKTVEKKSDNGNTATYDVRRVQTDRFTMDPFSAAYLVRGLDWKVGVEKVFDVYPGKYQYELRLKCDSLVTVDINGEKRKAWVIIPTVTNLDPQKRAEALKKKPMSTRIYVSADDLKDVLKIEASHTLGNFRVLMVRFDPAVDQHKEAAPVIKEINVPAGQKDIKSKDGDVPNKPE
jgi:hypothetical protein